MSTLQVGQINDAAGNTALTLSSGNTTLGGTLTTGGNIDASSHGIYLGANAASNLLDDYEEGTWTPSWYNGTGQTYSNQYGYYTKVGNIVTISCFIVTTDMNSQTGDAWVEGLPFNPSAETLSYAWGVINGDNNWDTNLSGTNMVGQIVAGSPYIRPRKNSGSNTADIQLQEIGGGNSYFGCSVTYRTA